MKTIVYHDFKTLRKAYIEIREFINEPDISLNTQLVKDLGYYGDDNYFLLLNFIEKYQLEYKEFDYSKHFFSEGEIIDYSQLWLWPINLYLFVLRQLSFGKINVKPVSMLKKVERTVVDMSFGDMVTWYLTGSYNTREYIKFMLNN